MDKGQKKRGPHSAFGHQLITIAYTSPPACTQYKMIFSFFKLEAKLEKTKTLKSKCSFSGTKTAPFFTLTIRQAPTRALGSGYESESFHWEHCTRTVAWQRRNPAMSSGTSLRERSVRPKSSITSPFRTPIGGSLSGGTFLRRRLRSGITRCCFCQELELTPLAMIFLLRSLLLF